MNRRKALVVLAAAPLIARSEPVTAGGMAVVYLIGPTPVIRAGVPFTLRFAVLGHDMIDHLWNGFDCEITATPTNGGERLTFAVPGKAGATTSVGAYSTEIMLPVAGSYKWSIQPGSWEPTYFPPLYVHDANSLATQTTDDVIEIRPDGFYPSLVEVSTGSSLTWRNLDSNSAHQVTWADMTLNDSPLFRLMGEFSTQFHHAGTFHYFCGPHPHMRGTVFVTDI